MFCLLVYMFFMFICFSCIVPLLLFCFFYFQFVTYFFLLFVNIGLFTTLCIFSFCTLWSSCFQKLLPSLIKWYQIVTNASFHTSSSISQAIDARLEYGVETGVEIALRRLSALGVYNLPLGINATIHVNSIFLTFAFTYLNTILFFSEGRRLTCLFFFFFPPNSLRWSLRVTRKFRRRDRPDTTIEIKRLGLHPNLRRLVCLCLLNALTKYLQNYTSRFVQKVVYDIYL